MKFTAEQLEKIKAAKTAEELIALAKAEGIEATEEQIRAQYAAMHKESEIADDELDNVSGGCNTAADRGSIYYVVVPGDTLAEIANRFHTSTQAIFDANKEICEEYGICSIQEFNEILLKIKVIRIGY